MTGVFFTTRAASWNAPNPSASPLYSLTGTFSCPSGCGIFLFCSAGTLRPQPRHITHTHTHTPTHTHTHTLPPTPHTHACMHVHQWLSWREIAAGGIPHILSPHVTLFCLHMQQIKTRTPHRPELPGLLPQRL